MNPTPYPDINGLLQTLASEIRAVLDTDLVGLYLYGSLVWGDFNPQTSDIDLLVVIQTALDAPQFDALQRLHEDFVKSYPRWENRIELAYVPKEVLQTFKWIASTIWVISPGEPFHDKEAGRDWTINWYMVREKGVTLYGPVPDTIIPPISKEEFIEAVKEQASAWRTYIYEMKSRPAQAYGILTLCRALYAVRHGEQVSKRHAALWAQKELPQWQELIQNALLWREAYRPGVDSDEQTLAEAARFVHYVISAIERS